MAYPKIPAEIRFWKKVNKTDTCWLWTGAKERYGFIKLSHTEQVYTHRYSWELHFGTIPEGMFVCHKCDVTLCVRPDHLFLGTDLDNVRDRNSKGRNPDLKGEKNAMAKLTKEEVIEIRNIHENNRRGYAVTATKYRVSPGLISLIMRREIWKHI